MKLLVTGANGFIARTFCAEATALGFSVRGVIRDKVELPVGVESVNVGDIDGSTNWEKAMTGIDVVIHLAARVHVMHEDTAEPLNEFRRVNVEGTKHLASQAAKCGVKRFVYVSSVKVNGEETSADAVSGEVCTAILTNPQRCCSFRGCARRKSF